MGRITLLLVLFYATTTCISAYNITYFLSNHQEFSTFNDLLTKTGVDKAINRLNSTITVLAVDNSAIGPISSQSQSAQQTMLATHVLLDYFDTTKLKEMKEKTPRGVTNLYQKTGKSSGKQGTSNIVKQSGEIFFYSAVDGAPKNSKLVKEVGSKPFDIIVLQINTPIVVPGLNSTPIASPPPATPPPKSSPAPSPSNSSAPEPAADDGAVADAPEAKGPATASTPAPSPSLPPEDAPADDEPPAKGTRKNGGGRNMVHVAVVFVGFLAMAL